MAKRLVVSGLVGGLFAATVAGAAAQEAASPDGCTGFMCKVFGSRLDDRPHRPPR